MKFVAQRVLAAAVLLLAMTVITFALTRSVPGDPAYLVAGEHAPRATIERVHRQLGLDDPLPAQYIHYVDRLLHGNLGVSYQSRRPVLNDIRHYAPPTLELVVLAVFITLVVGVLLGIVGAWFADSALDRLITLVSSATTAMPVFWIGLLLQLVFYYWIKILPGGGQLPTSDDVPATTGFLLLDAPLHGQWGLLGQVVTHLLLPVATVSLIGIGVTVRVMRQSLLHEASQPYALVARSKGLSRWQVTSRHLLRNALNPVMALVGVQFGYAIVGTVLVESIFAWPGLGSYAYDAITNLDYPAIMGVTLFVAVAFVVVNALVDVVQAALDPRARS